MTISSTTTKARFTANGSNAVFPVAFRFTAATDLTVYLTPTGGALTQQTLNTDYTVADATGGTDFDAGGNVTFKTAPASGALVTILRVLPLTQNLDLTTNGRLPAESLESELDRLTMIAQQQQEELDRAVKLGEDTASTATPDALAAELNTAVNNASASATNAANSATQSANSATQAANSATQSANSATQAAASAVAAANSVTAVTALDNKLHHPACGRLTLYSGDPEGANSVAAGTTLYYSPYTGNDIALYDGTKWANYSFVELSLALTGLAANTNYDIFVYNNAGTLTLSVTPWSTLLLRATALVRQDGVWVKSGAPGYRYLGTIGTTATAGTCAHTQNRRFVWNFYNQVMTYLQTSNSNTSWTYSTVAAREYNGGTGQTRGEYVSGFNAMLLPFMEQSAQAGQGHLYLRLDGTAELGRASYTTSGCLNCVISYPSLAGQGYHYLSQYEYCTGTALTTWGIYPSFVCFNS